MYLDQGLEEMADAIAVLRRRRQAPVHKTLATAISRQFCQPARPDAGKTLEQHLTFLRKYGKRHLDDAQSIPESAVPEEQARKQAKIAWAQSLLDCRTELVRAHKDIAGQPIHFLEWVRAAKRKYQ